MTLPREQTARGCARVLAPQAQVYHNFAGPWLLHFVLFAVLVAATCLVYQRDIDLGFFALDDPDYVTDNPWIRGFTGRNLGFIATRSYAANYSPLHLLSYTVDYSIAGPSAAMFHCSSNLWAGLIGGMVYLTALTLLGRWPAALLGASLFVVHPVHVEAVAWISSRKDLVAAAFALPAMIAYFRYRRGGPRRTLAYGASVLLLLFALAGKLSVVIVPAVWVLFDVWVERRRGWGVLLDKLPYVAIGVYFALRTMAVQPDTRHRPDLYVIGHTLRQDAILLTGFGEYVVQRPRPDPSISSPARLIYSSLPLFAVALPVLLWRFVSGIAAALSGWLVLALAPAQVLSFVHPVTDRYLFFSSAALCVILALAARRLMDARRVPIRVATGCAAVLVGLVWLRGTAAYLDEWCDPRSVWYDARQKSTHASVYEYLGGHYQDAADQIPVNVLAGGAPRKRSQRFAVAVWSGDSRLAPLLGEWHGSQPVGPRTADFVGWLRLFAGRQFDEAVRRSDTHLMPILYFRRGKLATDLGDLECARKEFAVARAQAEDATSVDLRNQMRVRLMHAQAMIEWRAGNYDLALAQIHQAEKSQNEVGAAWVPDIAEQREYLERLARGQ